MRKTWHYVFVHVFHFVFFLYGAMPTWTLSNITTGQRDNSVIYHIEILTDTNEKKYAEYVNKGVNKNSIGLQCGKCKSSRLVLSISQRENNPLKTEKVRPSRNFQWVSDVSIQDRKNGDNYGNCKSPHKHKGMRYYAMAV